MFLQVLLFVIIGIILLWFGHTLLAGQLGSLFLDLRLQGERNRLMRQGRGRGEPGEPQVCPVCSARLLKSYQVKSQAFPSLSGGKDRLMHINGCIYCIQGERTRVCPVCGSSLSIRDILVARMFERPGRNHVHVLGCSRCRKAGKLN